MTHLGAGLARIISISSFAQVVEDVVEGLGGGGGGGRPRDAGHRLRGQGEEERQEPDRVMVGHLSHRGRGHCQVGRVRHGCDDTKLMFFTFKTDYRLVTVC